MINSTVPVKSRKNFQCWATRDAPTKADDVTRAAPRVRDLLR